MCGVSAFKLTAQTAYFVAAGSAMLIPNAWPAVSIIYEGQGDPDQILHAAMDWWKVNDQLGEVMQLSAQLRSEIAGDTWTGEDQDQHATKLSEYENQCMWSGMHAAAVSMSMYAVMAMLIVFITMMAVVAAILFALALYVIAMYVASFFTAGASAAAAQAKANIIAGKCYAVLKTTSGILEKIMQVTAAVVGGFTGLIGVGGNVASGNWAALADLGKGIFHSLDDVIAGALGKLDQSIASGLMKGRMGGQQLFGWTVPTASLPRDARFPIAILSGIKGIPEVGFGEWGHGSSIGLGSMYGPREYGDDYVEKTHPTDPKPEV